MPVAVERRRVGGEGGCFQCVGEAVRLRSALAPAPRCRPIRCSAAASRKVRRSQYASFCRPPESVTTTARRLRRGRASRGSRAGRSLRHWAAGRCRSRRARGACADAPGRRTGDRRADCGDDCSQPVGLGVRLPVDRQRGVGRRRARRAPPRDRREDPRRVGHHVADDLEPPGDAFDASCLRDRSSGTRRSAASRSTSSRFRSSGIVEVEAAQPRLDVGDRDAAGRVRAGETSSSCRRRRAPSPAARARSRRGYPDPSRRHPRCAGRGDSAGSGMSSSSKKTCDIPVSQCWPEWSDDLVDPGVASASESGRRLDELGAVPDDGEDAHRVATIAALRCGPLAQLVEQGTLNPKVEGSIPSRPIRNARFRKRRGWVRRAVATGGIGI